MKARSPWQRPLQALAALLAIVIVALFLVWIDPEPAPPVRAAHGVDAPTATPVVAANADLRAAPAATTPAPAAAPEAAGGTPAPAVAPAVLFGAVRHADGTAVTDGVLWVYHGGKHVGTESLRGGTFAFAGLQPGTHRLTSRIPDELPLEREVDVIAPATRLDVDLAARWLLRVDAVTADGAPLRDALPQTSPMFFRGVRARAFRDALAGDLPGAAHPELEAGLGAYRGNDPFGMRGDKALPKQTVGVLALPADQPVHVALMLGGALLAQQQVSAGQPTVTFVLGPDAVQAKTGSVRLRCVDGAGAPIAGVRVSVGSGSGTSFGEKQVTDADGRFVASGLLPGRVTFGAYHEQQRLPPVRVDLAPGADLDLGDLVLRPVVEVELTFAGFGGNGSVRTLLLDVPAGARWRTEDGHHSEQNGTAQKLSLYPGRYALLARGENGMALLELDTAALPAGPLRFDLRPTASLQIDNRVGEGVASFEIANVRGVPVYRGELGSRRGFAIQLLPGDYRVTVATGAGAPQTRAFTLPAAGAVLALP